MKLDELLKFAVREEGYTGERDRRDGSKAALPDTVCYTETKELAEAIAKLWKTRGDVRDAYVVPLEEK